MSGAEVVVIAGILLVAFGFILCLAAMIYFTFRVRTRGRLKLKNYPVYVLPSPKHARGSCDDILQIIPKSEFGTEPVKLKGYRKHRNSFTGRDFKVKWSKRNSCDNCEESTVRNGGVENPVFLVSEAPAGDGDWWHRDRCESDPGSLPGQRVPDDLLALELERTSQRRSRIFNESKNTLQYLALRNSFVQKRPPGEDGKRRTSESNPEIASDFVKDDSQCCSTSSINNVGKENKNDPTDDDILCSPLPPVRSQHKLRRDLAEAIACDQVVESSVQFAVTPDEYNPRDYRGLTPSPIFWLDMENGGVDYDCSSAAGERMKSGTGRMNLNDENQASSSHSLAVIDGALYNSYYTTPLRRAGSPVEVICKQRTAV